MADHLSPNVRPAFPSSAIISERSPPSRIRFAAPNNGAPLTAPGRSGQHLLGRGKGSLRTARLAGDHLAAILVPFFAATDRNGRFAHLEPCVERKTLGGHAEFSLRSDRGSLQNARW